MIRELEENPYPEDVFPKITKEELQNINTVLKKELGIPLDRLSGNISRVMFDNIKEVFAEELQEEKQRISKKLEEFIVFMESNEYSGRQINSFEKHFAEWLKEVKR